MIPVTVKSENYKKSGQEGWEEMVQIREILEIHFRTETRNSSCHNTKDRETLKIQDIIK